MDTNVTCDQVHAVVGVLSDDTDPMVTVMKLEKAPTESYADIGGNRDSERSRPYYFGQLSRPQ